MATLKHFTIVSAEALLKELLLSMLSIFYFVKNMFAVLSLVTSLRDTGSIERG